MARLHLASGNHFLKQTPPPQHSRLTRNNKAQQRLIFRIRIHGPKPILINERSPKAHSRAPNSQYNLSNTPSLTLHT